MKIYSSLNINRLAMILLLKWTRNLVEYGKFPAFLKAVGDDGVRSMSFCGFVVKFSKIIFRRKN